MTEIEFRAFRDGKIINVKELMWRLEFYFQRLMQNFNFVIFKLFPFKNYLSLGIFVLNFPS